MNIASKQDSIDFTYPYKFFVVTTEESDLEPLTKDELRSLVEFYFSDGIKSMHAIILRRFLFSCCTGLRISDLKRLTIDNFVDGKMSLRPHKTEKYGTKVINKPLSDLALSLLHDEIQEADDRRLFHRYTEVTSNKELKEIAKHQSVGIKRRIYHHVGRATFASLYDQAGGNHRSLMEYMGLKKMNTLMRYVKTNEKVIAEAIDKMNSSMKNASIPAKMPTSN
jgi:integrase/recombinase XerD